jgi:hypothetical protein
MSQKDAKRLYLAPLEERPATRPAARRPGWTSATRGRTSTPALDPPRQTSAPDPLKRGRAGLSRRRP